MRHLAAAVAIIAALAFAAAAHAQAPTPTAEPELSMFPYRIDITGPASMPAGQPVTFDVRYQRVSSAAGSDNEIVLVHEGADFGSIAARQSDAPNDLGPQNADAERIALLSDSGEFDVTLRPHTGFTGALTLSFYVPGTGIALPEGTVDHATSAVAPAGAMVITGEVPAPPGTQVRVDAEKLPSAQPLPCDKTVSTPASTDGTSLFLLIVAPDCVHQASNTLRICWAPDACAISGFDPGEHDLGLLHNDLAMPASTPTSVVASGSMQLTASVAAPAGSPVVFDVLRDRTFEPCGATTTVPSSDPTQSRIDATLGPGCAGGIMGLVRIVVNGQAASFVEFRPGTTVDAGLLVPGSLDRQRVAGPNTGDGTMAARPDRTPLVIALALAAIAGVVLGSGFAVRRRRQALDAGPNR